MTTLKFRAWDEDSQKMNGNVEIYIAKDKTIEVCPKDNKTIVMQSTGLKDRNGVEIFEGDVIEVKRLIGPRFLVKKHEKTTQFVLQANFGREYFGTFGQDELEVIGNIWEYSELTSAH